MLLEVQMKHSQISEVKMARSSMEIRTTLWSDHNKDDDDDCRLMLTTIIHDTIICIIIIIIVSIWEYLCWSGCNDNDHKTRNPNLSHKWKVSTYVLLEVYKTVNMVNMVKKVKRIKKVKNVSLRIVAGPCIGICSDFCRFMGNSRYESIHGSITIGRGPTVSE